MPQRFCRITVETGERLAQELGGELRARAPWKAGHLEAEDHDVVDAVVKRARSSSRSATCVTVVSSAVARPAPPAMVKP
ncbi:MAG: hypothetical protein ABR570_15595 [Burkholderiales bacterium]